MNVVTRLFELQEIAGMWHTSENQKRVFRCGLVVTTFCNCWSPLLLIVSVCEDSMVCRLVQQSVSDITRIREVGRS